MKKNKTPESPDISSTEITWIAAGTHFKGTLHAEGTVRVGGTITGDIKGAPQSTIIVDEFGVVDGTIHGGECLIQGRMNGTLEAYHRAVIGKNAQFVGEIRAQQLAIEPGAMVSFTTTSAKTTTSR